jgi:hypothetical protein
MNIQIEIKKLEQVIIEDTYGKHNIRKYLKLALRDYFDNHPNQFIPQDRYELYVTNILLLTIDYPSVLVTSLLGVVAQQLDMEYNQALCTVLDELQHLECIDIYDSEYPYIIPKISLQDEIIEYIKSKEYLPPMVCRPRLILKNTDEPYLTKRKGSVILGDSFNHHDKPLALDVLNTLGKVQLSLDEDILSVPRDNPDDDEMLAIFDATSAYMALDIVHKYDNTCYLPWKYDKRGRVYSQGYHINIQSDAYNKALINLNKPITLED